VFALASHLQPSLTFASEIGACSCYMYTKKLGSWPRERKSLQLIVATSLNYWQNILECLSLASHFQLSLPF
jgi:hypothetical protein